MENLRNKKILMALMSFSIGGAETHVLELALELKRRGLDVSVVSGGGEYEDILKEYGIPHFNAPLYTKKPSKMIKAYKILKKIIREQKFDIVHAHGRIPAFLCGILHKNGNFVFVTTAHWVFNTGYGLKYLSNWGEKVVAVSEDIKDYLMINYNINPTDIFVTINGIDTEKFSPNTDGSSIIREFGLSESSRKIVYISRMDEDRAEVAFRLVHITEEILKADSNTEIIIVGGGNVFDKLKNEAYAVNKRVGRNVITLTGARTDIYKFAALSDIFVGVSRSALEAMSCAKPVIVAGNEGYIGIFDEDKLADCIETNFCCRGMQKSSDELLKNDILRLIASDEEELKRLGNFSRQTIIERYSVSKMADDNIEMYCAATDKYKYDAVLSGYYGFGNSGDEALLCGIIKNLRAADKKVRICVLSKSPEKTAKEYGVVSINRYNMKKIKEAINSAGLFISGGGSLLQDVTSSKSLWYYESLIKTAHSSGTKIMLYANGIGPINKERNRKRTKECLEYADIITLREEGSLGELKALGIENKNIYVTADPALSVEPSSDEETEAILAGEGIDISEKMLGVSLRDWKNAGADFADKMAAAIKNICQKHHITPVFIPLKPDDDIKTAEKIIEKTGTPMKILKGNYNASQMIGIIGKMDIMIAMRLHAVIYSVAGAVPAVSISYDPKVDSFSEYAGIESCIDIRELSAERIEKEVSAVFEKREEIKNRLKEKNAELRKKTAKDAELAFDLIKSAKAR